MKTQKKMIDPLILQDIISAKSERIEKQNKYKSVITWFSFCISMLAMIFVFEWKSFDQGSVVQLASLSTDLTELIDVPITEQPPPPKPAIQQPIVIEAPNDVEIEDVEIKFDIFMDEEDIIEEIIVSDEPAEEEAEEIHQFVQEMPSPVGGLAAFYKYLGQNLKYPAQARRIGIEGRVFLSFVVEKDGSLTDISVMKGIGAGCDEESVRVLENAPSWNPGKQRGNPVRVRYAFPVVFKLQ